MRRRAAKDRDSWIWGSFTRLLVGGVAGPAVLVWAFIAAVSAQGNAPTLVSDKADYMPGQVATLTGTGFSSYEAIDLSISIDDPSTGTHIADYAWAGFDANEEGGFVAQYTVPPEASEMTLVATAIGLSSGLVAKATFTDHPNSPVTSSSFAISATANHVLTVSVNLGGGAPITAAVAKVEDQTNSNAFDLVLVGPGGNGNGTWSASFQGVCGTTYKINNVKADWTSTQGGDHTHNATQTPAGLVNVTTGVCPPANQPPVVTCLDPVAQLGQIIGTLTSGSFQAIVNITYSFSNGHVVATFDLGTPGPSAEDVSVNIAQVADPDINDTLQVNAVGPTSVTLIGPGSVDADLSALTGSMISITASDGVISVPVSAACDATVKAQITYNFVGFGAPLGGANATRLVKRGSTVPVKFRLYDGLGTEICLPLGGGHTIGVVFSQPASPYGEPDIDDSGSSNENNVFFRYSGVCGVDGTWIYNLQTNASYYVNATYRIEAHLDDGTVHETYISIKR